MDTLPVELRLRIFRFALQAVGSLVRSKDLARKASTPEKYVSLSGGIPNYVADMNIA